MSISSTSASKRVAGFDAAFTNGIQVHDDDVDQAETVRIEGREVVGSVAPRENAAVQRRVQRLHPAVHHLGETGQVGHPGHGESGIGQRPGGAAGETQFEAAGGQSTTQFNDTGLVRNAQKGSWHSDKSPVLSPPTPGGPGAVGKRPHTAAFFIAPLRSRAGLCRNDANAPGLVY